eukprot:CAMPEP_0197660716 /NCGR_PEP_ID=MMETSP1338-20131121/51022_1 /TAXON_ID=43686 ORGANISM="Pelagodinium beii, Strain RCC1491" /NCGR_SAMPLE_ID=MMETSP1338 /ASSEMBLY_ACC=CAM_ASM_000754 /LENGTH=96 /DNA_ID=CAMNT_0043238133 /DNA_START=728 /DNA_END=1015 /DNA_ORIENTATION=-
MVSDTVATGTWTSICVAGASGLLRGGCFASSSSSSSSSAGVLLAAASNSAQRAGTTAAPSQRGSRGSPKLQLAQTGADTLLEAHRPRSLPHFLELT